MIDPNKPVRLKKAVFDPKTGNTYPPLLDRAYQPGELPVHLLNDGNAVNSEGEVFAPPQNTIAASGEIIIQPSEDYRSSDIETKVISPQQPETKKPNAK